MVWGLITEGCLRLITTVGANKFPPASLSVRALVLDGAADPQLDEDPLRVGRVTRPADRERLIISRVCGAHRFVLYYNILG